MLPSILALPLGMGEACGWDKRGAASRSQSSEGWLGTKRAGHAGF